MINIDYDAAGKLLWEICKERKCNKPEDLNVDEWGEITMHHSDKNFWLAYKYKVRWDRMISLGFYNYIDIFTEEEIDYVFDCLVQQLNIFDFAEFIDKANVSIEWIESHIDYLEEPSFKVLAERQLPLQFIWKYYDRFPMESKHKMLKNQKCLKPYHDKIYEAIKSIIRENV